MTMSPFADLAEALHPVAAHQFDDIAARALHQHGRPEFRIDVDDLAADHTALLGHADWRRLRTLGVKHCWR
ncbi:hypothetical protein ACTMU2_22940 [Cupriavidus basilensis]